MSTGPIHSVLDYKLVIPPGYSRSSLFFLKPGFSLADSGLDLASPSWSCSDVTAWCMKGMACSLEGPALLLTECGCQWSCLALAITGVPAPGT